jgi:predicted nuclease with TOPRIM domain
VITGVIQQKMDQIEQLKIQISSLEERIKKLEKETGGVNIEKRFEDIKFYPFIKVDNLIIKYSESTAATEPTILANQVMLWKDTTNTKYYLKANFNGTAKKIELT